MKNYLSKTKKVSIIEGVLLLFIFFTFLKKVKITNKSYNTKFIKEIQNTFSKNNKVNINKIEEKIFNNKLVFNNIKSIINIGFTLDHNFILQTKLTVASIIATQNKTTKVRLHFGVTNNFTSEDMISLYSLRYRINNLTEFNFYYLKDSIKKMKNFHPKGEACPGKFELPKLLPNDVERLIIFDAGDVLVFRDLSELYNYNMNGYWALGPPEPRCIYHFVQRLNISKYLNIGSILLNVNEFKNSNFWDSYTRNKDIKKGGMPDQTLFNIILPDDKKDYFPFRFGSFALYCSDYDSDNMKFINFGFEKWFNSTLSANFPQNPGSEIGILAQSYNPLFIHHICGKWAGGRGLSIFRLLAKYFINIAGMKEEICKTLPGYCL